MSLSIGRFICPACGSTNVTYNPTDDLVTCNDCRYEFSPTPRWTGTVSGISPESVTVSSAGTVIPEPLAETEEVYRTRVWRRVRREVFPHTHEEFIEIEKGINELKESIKELQSRILPKVVVVEEIPKEEAKARVEEYFKEHETADIEELMLNLKIPVETLVEIIDELKQEGKIITEEEETT